MDRPHRHYWGTTIVVKPDGHTFHCKVLWTNGCLIRAVYRHHEREMYVLSWAKSGIFIDEHHDEKELVRRTADICHAIDGSSLKGFVK